eukprot:366551-Chlamydomonas_euryale.AAC.42
MPRCLRPRQMHIRTEQDAAAKCPLCGHAHPFSSPATLSLISLVPHLAFVLAGRHSYRMSRQTLSVPLR